MMNERIGCLLFAGCSLLATSTTAATTSEVELPESYRTWVDEAVVCIISDFERKSFLSLADDPTRDAFIKAFWHARDPTTGTERNEYKEDYDKRVTEADDLFGSKRRRGYEDPRGRIYIQLGPPQFRARYPMEMELHPIEHWFYQGRKAPGLPKFFSVLFFKQHGVGKYELYDPVSDGPEALVGSFLRRRSGGIQRRTVTLGPKTGVQQIRDPLGGGGLQDRRKNAMRALANVSAELQRAALSLDPTEPVNLQSGLVFAGATRLVGKLHDLENTQPVDESYVRRVLEGNVDVDYSFRNLGMVAHFHGAFGDDRAGRLHYSIEIPPASMTLQNHKKLTTGALDVIGRIFTSDGKTPVFQIDEHVEISLSRDEAARVSSFPFAFVDAIPLVPGKYRADLIVRDLITQDFGTIDGEFEIPARDPNEARLGAILVADRTRPAAEVAAEPFAFAGKSWRPAPSLELSMRSDLLAAMEIYTPAASADTPPKATWSIRNSSGGTRKQGKARLAEPGPNGIGTVTVSAPLKDLDAGSYELEIAVKIGGTTLRRRSPFTVRESGISPPPWVWVNPRGTSSRQTELALADQHVALGHDEQALDALRETIRLDPSNLEARQRLAAFYLKRKDYRAAVETIDPIIVHGQPTAYEYILLGLGRSGIGNTNGAIRAYERAAADSPENTRILNLLGEERMHAGQNEAAATALNRSLAIEPDQPNIRVMLVELATR